MFFSDKEVHQLTPSETFPVTMLEVLMSNRSHLILMEVDIHLGRATLPDESLLWNVTKILEVVWECLDVQHGCR